MPTRIAVLASGGGTNLQALLDHFDRLGQARSGDVALVISDRAGAGALARAEARGIPHAVVPASAAREELVALLQEHDVQLIALAGYLRLVPAAVVRAFHDRIVNVHPALLPAFGGPGMYGMRVHAAVLAAGARVTGVTVHVIDEVYDRGRILAQWPVPVFADDSPETLGARVLQVEHLLFPRVVAALCAGREVRMGMAPAPSFLFDTADPARLAKSIDAALGT